MSGTTKRFDTIVIGGGLAGLTAATFAARGGHRVLLLERSRTLGGRAATLQKGDFSINLGPHALYASGEGTRVLGELQVQYPGKRPAGKGLAESNGRMHALPAMPWSLVTTKLLSWRGKAQVARLMPLLRRVEADTLHDVTVADWIDQLGVLPDVRALLFALCRLTTFANAPGVQSAAAFVHHLQLALKAGVYYVDDGWQTLVDGLAERAIEAGATIRTEAAARSIRCSESIEVGCESGAFHAHNVIIATPPRTAVSLVASCGLVAPAGWRACRPVVAACLDIALERLTDSRRTFVLGIDEPTYLSVHSTAARLAPDGAALVHVAKYVDPSTSDDPASDRRQLEALLDRAQPGWRDVACEQRYLPRMEVASALEEATRGGMRGRPTLDSAAVPGVFVAGDWVGPIGVLSNASLVSGKEAACAALTRGGHIWEAA